MQAEEPEIGANRLCRIAGEVDMLKDAIDAKLKELMDAMEEEFRVILNEKIETICQLNREIDEINAKLAEHLTPTE